ncbi:MAG: hypothetical protein AAF483_03335 [Planctomycetota bacterium]
MEARMICSPLAASVQAGLRSAMRLALYPIALILLEGAGLAQTVFMQSNMPVAHRRSAQYVAHGENFFVFASSPQFAEQVLQAAEKYRRDLAMHWLGKELPPWPQRCPVHVSTSPNMGASGRTEFGPTARGVGNWNMVVNGTPERILDSVLPHEISHTILASHFARYTHLNRFVPRWADEGACTTVEHEAEKRKHRHFLEQFLRTGRGLAFNQMFALKEYPGDMLPLYAQGHSAVQFLIDQSSPREFVEFLETGMETQNWQTALQKHYQYETIGQFQFLWNKWLLDHSPADLLAYAPKLRVGLPGSGGVGTLASSSVASNAGPATPPVDTMNAAVPSTGADAFRNRQLDGKIKFAIGNTDPTPAQLASNQGLGTQTGPSNRAIEATTSTSGTSWYKNRLREVSGAGQATIPPQSQSVLPPAQVAQVTTPEQLQALPTSPVPPRHASPNVGRGNQVAVSPGLQLQPSTGTNPNGLRPYGSARLQPIQTPRVRVLQWGPNSPP